MKRGYRRRLAALAAVGAILLLVVVARACSSEDDETVIVDIMEHAEPTFVYRGSVIARSTSTPNSVTNIVFQVIITPGGDPVNLSDTGTNAAIVTYNDKAQSVTLAAGNWSATWTTGSGDLLDPGETVEIDVTVSGLTAKLKTNQEFTIQLKPPLGNIIMISWTTPLELTQVMDLN